MALITHTKGALDRAPKVFIAIPTYSGKLDARLVHSLVQSLPMLEKEQIGFELFTLSYSCHVDDARNQILSHFRQSGCDELVFIDADVSFEPESLLRLVKHDRDVVAGVYPKRSLHDLEFPVVVEQGVELWRDNAGLVEVAGAPTGFMKIKRHVIEKMAKVNAHRNYYLNYSKPGDVPMTIIFERTFENGTRFSGDLSFCRAWRKMGGKVFVDPEMHLTHTGEAQFSGTLGDYWKEKYGVSDNEKQVRFTKAVQNLRAGKCSEQDFLDLSNAWGNPFAANPALLAACYLLAKKAKGSVIETGSGLSTLVMALANPGLTIHCLEHEILWASKLKQEMRIHKIENIVVHLCELKNYGSGDWYELPTLPENVSLALCDGPPRRISDRSIFYDQLSERIKDAVVLMDDADDEAAVLPLRDWATRHGREVKVLGNKRRFAVCKKAV